MKLPNGYGTCYRVHVKNKKPFIVKKTIDGKQRILGYFDTKEEGLKFLKDVNENKPVEHVTHLDDDMRNAIMEMCRDVFTNMYSEIMNTIKNNVTHSEENKKQSYITFADLYQLWSAQHFKKVRAGTVTGYKNAYMHCKRLHNMIFSSIRLNDLDAVINDIRAKGTTYGTQKKVRSMIGQMYKYAIRYDMATKNYAEFVEIDMYKKQVEKTPFSKKEIKKLWQNADDDNVKHVLCLIFSGMRCGEYLNVKRKDVNLKTRFIKVCESKTDAGRGRLIPIPHRILPFYKEFLKDKSKEQYLCDNNNKKFDYIDFRKNVFNVVMENLNMKHTPHECRHTLASLLDSAEINRTVIKLILGHSLQGVTERHYTHKTNAELLKAIDKIC